MTSQTHLKRYLTIFLMVSNWRKTGAKIFDDYLDEARCGENTENCENIEGSYECSCKSGYKKKDEKSLILKVILTIVSN